MPSVGLALALALAAAIVQPVARPTAAARLTRYEATRMSMACAYTIVAYGPDAASVSPIVEEAFDEVDRIDRLMSHYRPESPLSRLNREAARAPVEVEPELYDFVAECLRYSRESEGAFDVTVGPLMKAWGFFKGEGRVPDDGELQELRGRIGFSHVVLDAARRTIAFDRAGVELDLGGIAKGYAVDRVVDLLRRRGVTAALVSAGGSTIFGLGAPPGHEAWDVKVEDPLDPRRVAMTVALKDRALSVSGSAFKSFERDGVRYAHVMDPRTARPVPNRLGVAVLAPTGTAGDALDNAFFVLGPTGSRGYVQRLSATKVVFFEPRGKGGWRMIRLEH